MALKSHNWFLYEVLKIERAATPLSPLAAGLLDLGLGAQDSARGHVFQAIGAVQPFFTMHPNHKATIAAAPPVPYVPTGQVLDDWKVFLASKKPGSRNARFAYDFDTLKNYLTTKFGGKRTKGGGGDNELHRVLRLGADFL